MVLTLRDIGFILLSSMDWYLKTPQEIFPLLKTNDHGLSAKEAKRRLESSGANRLPEAKTRSLTSLFFEQFQSPLIYVLLIASGVVFVLSEFVDAFLILFVLLFNAIVGTIQEGRAQNTLAALKAFVKTSATVIRDGKELIIPDSEVVPGDIVLLQEGEKIPADGRLLEAYNLQLDEAALTGESKPVHKSSEPIERIGLQTAEQRNMAFKGTHVVTGHGKMVVAATGVKTVIGKISKEIAAIDTEIPLKGDIRHLSRIIIATVGISAAILFLVGIQMGNPLEEMFITVVALSVSVIPEGLPIVLTLVLATGVWRMSKRNALIKKLQAVEALGQANILAIDKTGTITRNELAIQKVFVDGKLFEVTGNGYEPKGEAMLYKGEGAKEAVTPAEVPGLLLAARAATFCASARISYSSKEKRWRVSGDPTEAALLVFGEKMGFKKDDMEKQYPLTQEIPFDYRLKYHATVHMMDKKSYLTIVGAPEVLLDQTKQIWEKGREKPFGKREREEIETLISGMSQEGLRVLAFAIHENIGGETNPETLPSLVFGGLYAMSDGIRTEVKDAIAQTQRAGIRVVMITGDHKITAQSVAKEVGIFKEGDDIITGKELEELSEKNLLERLDKTSVFARVAPQHKMRIVQAYKARGEVIAMTGDGVNDAPPLVAADLGVSLGTIGTEVAKEAADIVLLDDNLSSIDAAIEEGRSIYKTIKKVILYLFSTSLGEMITISAALLLGLPLPLVAAQIIWLNLVTDGFLTVALAMEPKEKGLLSRSFKRSHYLVDSLMASRMAIMSIPMAVGTLLLFSFYHEENITKAWTISLTTLAVFQWFNAWNCRSEEKSMAQMSPSSNPFLVGATIIIILLQLLAVYNPFMQQILRTTSISLQEWLLIIPIAFSIVIAEEVRKFIYRRINI